MGKGEKLDMPIFSFSDTQILNFRDFEFSRLLRNFGWKYLIIGLVILTSANCMNDKEQVDYIGYNSKVYTVDDNFSVQEAFAVKDGKFVAVGSSNDINGKYFSENIVNLMGKKVYPGFFDPHCHLLNYAETKLQAQLYATNSLDEVLERLQEFQETNEFPWLLGRGWDQNDWEVTEFPSKDMLDILYPDVPVFLTRIDGHAALLNQKALDLVGFDVDTKIERGDLLVDDGQLTGVILDFAIEEAEKHIPLFDEALSKDKLLEASEDCYRVGLTSIGDAGLGVKDIQWIERLQNSGELKMRMNIMVEDVDSSRNWIADRGKINTDKLKVQSVKYYADGALGSRGAHLLEPYHDDDENTGIPTITKERLLEEAKFCLDNDLQMCVHAIGDAANRIVLESMAETLGGKNNNRWRIEHCQVVNPNDFHYFSDYDILPSVQSTHGTSDMYWADERLGEERIKTAYAYKRLLDETGILVNGSDFPIEHINPLYGFYAAVARKDQKGYPDGGFQKQDAISREDALRAMTIWSAYAEFSENEKGSIEVGKIADFVIMSDDLITVPEETLFELKVDETWIGGERVY